MKSGPSVASRAVLCAWALVGVEWALVSLFGFRQLAGLWEWQFGSLWLWPSALFGSAGVALVAAGVWYGFERGQALRARAWLALVVACLASAAGWGVSTGRHFAELPKRVAFASGLAVLAALLVFWLAPWVARRLQQRPLQVGFAVLLAIVGLQLGNRFVLVRLYPGFHLALALLALLLAPGLQHLRPGAFAARAWHWGVSLLLGVALLTALPGAQRLHNFDNFRLVMLEQAPLLGQAVRLAAFIDRSVPRGAAAPGAVAEVRCTSPDCATAQNVPPLDLLGRDILLVTVDALRADHVGAYGYTRATTPNIDRLASEGLRFENAYCPTPHTSYSLTSLLTGKYMRPLLLQGVGEDSQTLADILRIYGYATAGFYPPAVFFIDQPRFERFEQAGLGFEYRKVEFMEGEGRVQQVHSYLQSVEAGKRVFLWVHLFAPHEPYETHPGHDFGARDVDRYDSEVAYADATVGALTKLMRERDPRSVVIATADHGEEFGEHGGRYHGSSVYEEQVRVPLVVSIPGLEHQGSVAGPVQTIDLFATLLSALHIPISPRVRARDLSAALQHPGKERRGFAFAETDDFTLLAEGSQRLICERRIDACKLYDVKVDPGQERDQSGQRQREFAALRERLQQLSDSHGEYERGDAAQRWPTAILRGMAGDAAAAVEIAALLDDSDVAIRRKAAELLFQLQPQEAAATLRLALQRDEDGEVQRYAALALTRMGQGAPLVYELLGAQEAHWRRLAALALAENGDKRGEQELIAWWSREPPVDFSQRRALVAALGRIHSKDSVWELCKGLGDVRLRPYLARALAEIGDKAALGPLLGQLQDERYHSHRAVLTEALLKLGAKSELALPLRRFLGVPDPLENGVGSALQAGVVEVLGGPSKSQLQRVLRDAALGEQVTVVVPKALDDTPGLRLLLRARNTTQRQAWVRLGRPAGPIQYSKSGSVTYRKLATIHPEDFVELRLDLGPDEQEVYAEVPASLGLQPGRSSTVVLAAETGVEVQGFVIVPRAAELPPPAPEPWKADH